MSANERFKLVIGYMPGIDRCPREARACELGHRVAFVLESYRPASVDLYFDEPLYVEIVRAIWQVLSADGATLVGEESSKRIADVDAFHRVFDVITSEPREPLVRIVFAREAAIVGIAESEPYARIGGPDVYHDSYTIAVFTRDNLSTRILVVANEIASRASEAAPEVVQGVADAG